MSKEMRPSHHIDVLSAALVSYGIRTKEKMGNCLNIMLYMVYTVMISFYVDSATLLLTHLERAMKIQIIASRRNLNQVIPGNFEGTFENQ